VRFPRATHPVLVFASERDARRVMEVLPKRFGKFGLSLHPEKTKLVDFRRPNNRGGGPVRFDLLGFTHLWGKSRKGRWMVQRRTAKDRFARALKRVAQWCKSQRHLPVRVQHQALYRKLKGHNQYYGITGNYRALSRFCREVHEVWQKWLNRRSQRTKMTWERFNRLLQRYPLPKPKVVHSVYAAKP
jgi:RNA-directed DNA polymerase